MESVTVELVPLLDRLKAQSKDWPPDQVLDLISKLGKFVQQQLAEYTAGKYRQDRNEIQGFFEAIEKFAKTGLPISLEHLNAIIDDYKKRILPYPHYSGIKVEIPEDMKIDD